jgi:hypothetical protein
MIQHNHMNELVIVIAIARASLYTYIIVRMSIQLVYLKIFYTLIYIFIYSILIPPLN